MGFRSGRAAWQRFRVKSAPQLTETELFAKLGDAVVPESFDVAPPDTIAGWCGGRHLLDRTFDADNLFGDAVLMGFRLDAFKLPADLRRAWQLPVLLWSQAMCACFLLSRPTIACALLGLEP